MEQRLHVPIVGQYEVAVCGGGIAGIAAALAAARQGKKTVLFERGFMLGGLATAGLITIYLPLCDGFGKQVSFGIAEELLKLSIQYGAEDRYPENWLDNIGTRGETDKRYQVQYNAQIFALLAEKILVDAGVEILYGSYVVSVDKKNDRIEHLIVENKTGRIGYHTGSVVDATGDCDIALFADAPTDTFQQGNVLAAWYYTAGENGYRLNPQGGADLPEKDKNAHNQRQNLISRRFSGLDGTELSEQMILTHRHILNHFLTQREKDPSAWIATLPAIPQLRMTRKLVGEYVLSEEEAHKFFPDSVGMISHWRKRGPVYEVPFRTLYSKNVKNLITAGRCVSTTETLWDAMRVIPCCAVTGEAAGTAAALTDDFSTLDVASLQAVLQKNGVVLHEQDIGR